MEAFSRTPPAAVLLWLPAAIWVAGDGLRALPLPTSVLLLFAGALTWTALEYLLHRFLFHADKALPPYAIAICLAFMLHGVHHKFPKDATRIVLPPFLSLLLASIVNYCAHIILPLGAAGRGVLMAGGILAYVAYDASHSLVHCRSGLGFVDNSLFMQGARNRHLKHHHSGANWGVSTGLWDWVFGTTQAPHTA